MELSTSHSSVGLDVPTRPPKVTIFGRVFFTIIMSLAGMAGMEERWTCRMSTRDMESHGSGIRLHL